MKLQNYVALGLVVGLVMSAMTACGEGPTAPTSPTQEPSVPVVVVPPVVTVPQAPEPFCPFRTFSGFAITEARTGVFHFSWDVVKENGKFLDRFQILVYRDGKEFTMLEAQVGKLGGPKDLTYIHEWSFPGLDPGPISAQIRVHYPNECRDDGNGNVRANGPWSDIVQSRN